MVTPMGVKFRELKDLLEKVRQKAQGARDSSDAAEREAAAGSEVRGRLRQSLRLCVGSGSGADSHSHAFPTPVFRTCWLW